MTPGDPAATCHGYFLRIAQRTGQFVEIGALVKSRVVEEARAGYGTENGNNHHHEDELDNGVTTLQTKVARTLPVPWRKR